jgi:hypothetical protein
VLLTLLYAAALAVAVPDLGARALPGAVVLAGLLLRFAVRRHRGPAPAAVVAPAVPAERPVTP